MGKRALAAGVLAIAAVSFLYLQNRPDNTPEIAEDVPISSEETESRLEEVLGRTLPDNAERAQLNDVLGNGFTAIATRAEDNGVVEFTVLADLPDPEKQVYQVWSGENADNIHSLGTLTAAKGGYLFEYRQTTSISDFNNVVISLETKADEIIEERVLQGSF